MDEPVFIRSRLLLFALSFCAFAMLSGCVHRRMTIESNPPGALVILDGKEVGYTPVSVDFTYYGTREVTLIKDGFETQTYPAVLRTPWYQRIPLDLISDNFLPTQVTDRHRLYYEMQPVNLANDSQNDLLNRGDAFRSEALFSQ